MNELDANTYIIHKLAYTCIHTYLSINELNACGDRECPPIARMFSSCLYQSICIFSCRFLCIYVCVYVCACVCTKAFACSHVVSYVCNVCVHVYSTELACSHVYYVCMCMYIPQHCISHSTCMSSCRLVCMYMCMYIPQHLHVLMSLIYVCNCVLKSCTVLFRNDLVCMHVSIRNAYIYMYARIHTYTYLKSCTVRCKNDLVCMHVSIRNIVCM